MKHNHFVLLLVVASLGFLAHRAATASGANACAALLFLPPQTSVQTVANATGDVKAAPLWELKDLDGKTVKLSDFKGKVVLLNFWATWCPPCRQEIPDLVALQNQYKDQGLVVIGVSVDQNGPAAVKSFATRMKINYPIVMGDEKTAVAYGNIEAIPTTFFIDRAGNVAGAHRGGATQSMFEEAVKPLLEKGNVGL